MTPKCKTASSTTLIIERKSKVTLSNDGLTHVAGGDHKGIVINKTAQSGKYKEYNLTFFLHLKSVYYIQLAFSSQFAESRRA